MADEEIVVRPDPPQPSAAAQRRPSGVASVAGYSRRGGDDLTVAVWSLGGPLGLTLFASTVQAAAAITYCSRVNPCQELLAFSVALGVISTLLISLYLIVFTFARDKLHEKSMMVLSAFLFLWWMAGIGATTFTYSVFQNISGTLYFATRAAFIFSGFIMHSEWEQFRNAISKMRSLEASNRSVFYLLLASIVETIAAAFMCGTPEPIGMGPECNGSEIYALIAGIISILLCAMLLLVDESKFKGSDKAVGLFLALWWAVGMGYLTISGPFISFGNGFFATWAAFLASFFVAQSKIFPMSQNVAND